MVNIQTLVFLDLEATGLLTSTHKPKITEITMIAVHCSEFLQAHLGSNMPRIINKMTLCFNPKKAMTPKAMEMTGLYNDALENQSEFDKDAATLIDVFLRRLAPPVCFLAHYGNRFDYPLLKAELLNAGAELTTHIVCADTWEMFRSLDNTANIPRIWTKSVVTAERPVANGVISRNADIASHVTPKQTDETQSRRLSQSSSKDEKRNCAGVTPTPPISTGGEGDGAKVGSSNSDGNSPVMPVVSGNANLLSSNASLSLLCGGDLKSLRTKTAKKAESCQDQAGGTGQGQATSSSVESATTSSSARSSSASPKVESVAGDKNSLGSPHAEGSASGSGNNKSVSACKSVSLSGSKVSDTIKGNGTRKMTSFSIKDIVTSDINETSSGESSPPAIVSSSLTCRGSSPHEIVLINSVNNGSVALPVNTSPSGADVLKFADVARCGVSNENLDSVNNNKSSKDNNSDVRGENRVMKDAGTILNGSVLNVAPVQCVIPENVVECSVEKTVTPKTEIRKPAKKRFSRGCESLKFDNQDVNHEAESVKTDISPKSCSPETVGNYSVKSASSGSPEAASASSNSAGDYGICHTPESHHTSVSQRICPRSPTKRKPSETNGCENDASQAKKAKKKLFESDSASVRELVRAASNSPGSDSSAEPVTSSQGNNNGDNDKPRLESLGTIIYWHEYFNEEFFKESLEMEDCLHPKPDSSSNSQGLASNSEQSPTDGSQNSDLKRPQTLSVSVSDVVNTSRNPAPVAHNSALTSQTLNATNPVLRSALTAPLNLSLKDRDEQHVTSSHANTNRAKSTNQDNPDPIPRLTTSTTRGQGNQSPNEDKPAPLLPQPKLSYSQREIYRRFFGVYPPLSHRSEDDCLTLMQIVQTVAPKAAIWLEVNSYPFHKVEPLYPCKGQ